MLLLLEQQEQHESLGEEPPVPTELDLSGHAGLTDVLVTDVLCERFGGLRKLLLAQCLTGDNWSGMMTDAMVGPELGQCTEEDGNCGSPAPAIPYAAPPRGPPPVLLRPRALRLVHSRR